MKSQEYPPLTPLLAPWMRKTLSEQSLLSDLFEEYGSPINLHHLKPFADNFEAYRAVLEQHKLRHTIFFARKANKCRAFAKEAQQLGFGVDTASYRELKQCLKLGCDSKRLVLTAAVKNEHLVRLALNNNVLIILDNTDECYLVNRMAGELGKIPKVGIRISGFVYNDQKLYSRFGFDVDTVCEFIVRHIGPDLAFDNLRFDGFHFHLNGYSIEQRADAMIQTIKLTDELREQSIPTSFIDMGGGLLVNYLSDKAEWNRFWRELKKSVQGNRSPVTFGNNGLGYKMVSGVLQGTKDVYPYYNETPKEYFLGRVLSWHNDEGKSIASLLRKRDIEFRMEPGRSLLDQTGMTLARVRHRKEDTHGNLLVGLEMNRSQLSSSSADFLLDPIYIPQKFSASKTKEPASVYFTGAYCLEQDIILKRKIVLPQPPRIGDMVAFPNTAGYMMHFYETESHLLEKTANLIAVSESPLRFEQDKN